MAAAASRSRRRSKPQPPAGEASFHKGHRSRFCASTPLTHHHYCSSCAHVISKWGEYVSSLSLSLSAPPVRFTSHAWPRLREGKAARLKAFCLPPLSLFLVAAPCRRRRSEERAHAVRTVKERVGSTRAGGGWRIHGSSTTKGAGYQVSDYF